MNENLFTFPGNASRESGENAFDLGNFADLSGDDPDNPFADLLEDTSAETDMPADEADMCPPPMRSRPKCPALTRPLSPPFPPARA